MKTKLLVACVCYMGFSYASAAEWVESKAGYSDEAFPAVSLKSINGESEVYIFRKNPRSASASGHSKDMVYLGFKTNSLDQINRRSAVIYKASKGRPLSLGAGNRISGFDNKIETPSFHGKASKNCGIISNILNSDKLTVRYFTTGQRTVDEVFELPLDNVKVYNLLGFTKGTDCVEIFE